MKPILFFFASLVFTSCSQLGETNQKSEMRVQITKNAISSTNIDERLIGEWGMCTRKYGDTYVHSDACSSITFTDFGTAIARVPSTIDQSYTWSTFGDSLKLLVNGAEEKELMFPAGIYKMEFNVDDEDSDLVLFLGDDSQFFLGKK